MKLREYLESAVTDNIEVSDKKRINVEVYRSLSEWQNHMYTFVNQREPYDVREVETIPISILNIDDRESRDRFEEMGKETSYYNMSLESIENSLNSNYTHVFLKDYGQLDADDILQLKNWIAERISKK